MEAFTRVGGGDRCVGFTLKYQQTKGVQGGLDEIRLAMSG